MKSASLSEAKTCEIKGKSEFRSRPREVVDTSFGSEQLLLRRWMLRRGLRDYN